MIFFKCVQKSKFLLSKETWIFLLVGKYKSRAPTARVSKSHGLTVMRQCKKKSDFTQNLWIFMRKLKPMHFNLFYNLFLNFHTF